MQVHMLETGIRTYQEGKLYRATVKRCGGSVAGVGGNEGTVPKFGDLRMKRGLTMS